MCANLVRQLGAQQAEALLDRAGGPSLCTVRRWVREGQQRRVQTGNAPASVLRGGAGLFYLLLFRLAWPKAKADHVRAFLFQVTGRIYAPADITRAEQRLGYKRRRTSTLSYNALAPLAQMRRYIFWNRPPPLGIVGVDKARIIDVDEFGVTLAKVDGRYAKVFAGDPHPVAPGAFHVKDSKLTVILAVAPNGDRWFQIEQIPGTSAEMFAAFLENQVFPYLPGRPRRRLFLWDNLGSHTSPIVYNAVTCAGHECQCRPTYRPEDAAVEYVINQAQQMLDMYEIFNLADLQHGLQVALGALSRDAIANTFAHVGI